MNHKQKVHLARKLMNKVERITSNKIQLPAFPRGTMISRLFTSAGWMRRKMARAGQFVIETAIPEEKVSEIKAEETKESTQEVT